MKAVLPAAGLGTRFLPLAKAVPKELLPLGNRPVIHYVVAEAIAAGFDDILIIISRGKEAIASYFTPNCELEENMLAKGKLKELERLRELHSLAKISYCYQSQMKGLGDAILQAKMFTKNCDMFAVLLADTVMQGESPLPAMVDAWKRTKVSSVALEVCDEKRVSRYGIAGGKQIDDHTYQLEALVEKPSLGEAPRMTGRDGYPTNSYHAFAARYLFSSKILSYLEETKPGYANEIQLTDAMEQLRKDSGMLGVTWNGRRLDIGSPAGLYEAARLMGLASF